VWITYGNHLTYPEYKKGESFPVMRGILEKGGARKSPWAFSHLRTFYAGLFKKIALEHLMYQGSFFPTTYDLAIMFPMIEMAREHTFFIPDIHYIYNFANPISDCKSNLAKQQFFDQWIRKLPVYAPLERPPSEEVFASRSLEVVLFTVEDPAMAQKALALLPKGRQKGRQTVIYSEKEPGQYDAIKEHFTNVHWIEGSEIAKVSKILEDSDASYVMFGSDRFVQKANFDHILDALDTTQAKLFLFNCREDVTGVVLPHHMTAFQFPHQAHLPAIDLAIYRIEPLLKMHKNGEVLKGSVGLAYSCQRKVKT
jgi:hypothetical protein